MDPSVVNTTSDGTRQDERASGPQLGISLDEWRTRLDTTLEGLSERAAYERLTRYGLNRIDEKRRNPLLKFVSFFSAPIAWMMEIAALLSIIAHHTAEFAITILLLIFSVILGYWQESRAAGADEAMRKQLAAKARVKREGKWREVDAAHLVPGDVVHLTTGDILPADVVLVHGGTLLVDQSALTGESFPVPKELQDTGYSGSLVKEGQMEALVTHTGSHTRLGRSARGLPSARKESELQAAVLRVGSYLIYLSLGLAALVFLTVLLRGASDGILLHYALILVVAAIPVAMPALFSVTMANGQRGVAKTKLFTTRLPVIEEVAGIDGRGIGRTDALSRISPAPPAPGEPSPTAIQSLPLASELESKSGNSEVEDKAVRNRVGSLRVLLTSPQQEFISFGPVRRRAEAVIRNGCASSYRAAKHAPQGRVS